MTGLNKRAKSIIQLKPRNPTSPIKGKLPIQAVCDFKQQEVRPLADHTHVVTSLRISTLTDFLVRFFCPP